MEKLIILLLEDNPLDAELALETLHEGGWDCRAEHVETQADFTAAIQRGGFDLILADYSLPSFDGLSALEIARATCPDVPFIFLSGAIGEELAIETLKKGATDYVLKQRMGRLIPSVRRALREAEDRRERQRAERELAELLIREQAARKEAETANRLKDVFLATVSHELRTPLNAILGWIQLLKGKRLDATHIERAIDTIERSARAQQKLIDDLLDISRIISDKLILEKRPMNPEIAVVSAVEAVRPTAEAKQVQLEVQLESKGVLVSGDSVRLEQICWNLLSNAIKFTPAGGRVNVRLRQVEGYFEIEVSDNGQGIAPNFLPHIFGAFRQEDDSSARKHGGLGLGLAIVHHLVQMHQGTIAVKSEGIGLGATFTVRLPALEQRVRDEKNATAATTLLRESNEDSTCLQDTQILVVDDATDTREFLALLLTGYGATVQVAGSAAEALAKIASWRPDVLISDIGMPEEDGYSLIRKVRKLESAQGAMPAIALTAFAQAQDRVQALTAGFNLHLPKPVDPPELIAVIASLLGRNVPAVDHQ
ncbi:MAG TPA: response regulator [Blastocatellia bacterium]|nr:response regulator [Blastocatellia bacterium]